MAESDMEKGEMHAQGNMRAIRETSRYKFLNALEKTGSVRCAAEISGKPRSHWLKLRERDGKFALIWDQAMDAYVEVLEAEADRRALSGEEEPVYYGGKQIGSRCKTSDSLLMFRLKALRPSRYKEMSQDNGSGLKVEVTSFLDMTPEKVAKDDEATS